MNYINIVATESILMVGTPKVTRHEWISVAAYYLAEKRGFAPGRALDDWLVAETKYANMLIETFLKIAAEDGSMSLPGLKRLADELGVCGVQEIHLQSDLIRAIQSRTGDRPCFQRRKTRLCNNKPECQWLSECQRLIAVWKR